MTDTDIQAGLRTVFLEVFGSGLPPLTPSMCAATVPGWDSIRMMAIIVGVERHFGVRLRARDVEDLNNVGDIADLLRRKLGARQTAPG